MPLGHVPLHTSIRHRYLCCSDVDSESKKKKEKPKNKNRSFLDSAFFFFFFLFFFVVDSVPRGSTYVWRFA